MSFDLAVIRTDEEKMRIAEDIGKLFDLHDRPLKDDKKLFILEEIVKKAYPTEAILAGLSKLMTEELKRITLHVIINAVEEHIESQPKPKVPCDDCGMIGRVVLYDDEKRGFAFACKCSNGDKFQLKRWNGEQNQYSNGRMLHVATD